MDEEKKNGHRHMHLWKESQMEALKRWPSAVQAWKTSELTHLVCLQFNMGCEYSTETHSEPLRPEGLYETRVFFTVCVCV